ncbi:cubilin-like [Palaemon carinicauda]|uniref:cubilin-like n=1 Tax=Palaemon carinicauda TaxID=392227 RepID=UPI0035B69769
MTGDIHTRRDSAFDNWGHPHSKGQCIRRLGTSTLEGTVNSMTGDIHTRRDSAFDNWGHPQSKGQCIRQLGTSTLEGTVNSMTGDIHTRRDSAFNDWGHPHSKGQCIQRLETSTLKGTVYSTTGDIYTRRDSEFNDRGHPHSKGQCIQRLGTSTLEGTVHSTTGDIHTRRDSAFNDWRHPHSKGQFVQRALKYLLSDIPEKTAALGRICENATSLLLKDTVVFPLSGSKVMCLTPNSQSLEPREAVLVPGASVFISPMAEIKFSMIRKPLLLLAGLLLLLVSTECAPKKPEVKKKRLHGHWWVPEPISTTKDNYHVSTIKDTYETSQEPQRNCNVSAGRVVASSGGIRIGSPHGRYNNDQHCIWEIQVPEEMAIQITWEYFDLEGPNPSCPYDFVDISEYATGKTLTGRVCGSEVPPPVTSRSNLVAVTFESDDSVTSKGFWLMFEAISVTTPPQEITTGDSYERTQPPHLNCSVDAGRVVGTTGEITLGAQNGTYNNNEQCLWEIQVPEGMAINFTWEAFDLEGPSPDCPYDCVVIWDYATGESLTGRLCGSNIPPPVVCQTNLAVVTFKSDFSVTYQGFTLKFEAIQDHYETTLPTETTTPHWHEITQRPEMKNCSVDAGPVMMPAGEITIGAPKGTYNNNEHCVWEIQVPEGKVINFTWEDFDLEGYSPDCPYDYVDISEYATGDTLTGRLCGSNIPPPIVSHSNFAVVTFISDTIVTLQGFTLKFEAIPGNSKLQTPHWHETTQLPQMNCSVDAGRVSMLAGEIKLGAPNGNYNNNEYCVWEIQVPQGMAINFTWEAFDLEGNSPGCPYDYVDISEYATGETLTGRLCGSNIPPPVISLSNFAVVTFISDSSVTLQGFTLKFAAIPGNPNFQLLVTTPPGHNETTQEPQMNCSVEAGLVRTPTGEITLGTPNETYNNNEHCVWEIQVPEGKVISFTWEAFDLEGPSPSCPYDYVDISENVTGDTLTGRLCGSNIPPPVVSHSNSAVVTFISDASVTMQGFTLKFEAISVTTPPGHNETTLPTETTTTNWYETTQEPQMNCSVEAGNCCSTAGEITLGTPNETYNNNEHCVWEIQVPEGKVISFTWEAFDLERCPYDYTINAIHIITTFRGRLCGSNIPPPVVSHSNSAVVTFISDASVTMQGFTLKFEAISETTTTNWYETTQEPQMNCSVDAGPVMMPAGEITLGAQNGTYNNNEHCVWEIQVLQGMAINFTWESFDLEGHIPGCPFDYVEISEYATGETLTGRLCGSNIPPPVVTQSNFAVVTFKSDSSVTLQGFKLKFEAIPGGAFKAAVDQTLSFSHLENPGTPKPSQMQISLDYMTWQQTDGQRDDRMKQQMMARRESEAGVRGAQTQMQISRDYMTWQQTDGQRDDRMKQQMMARRESEAGMQISLDYMTWQQTDGQRDDRMKQQMMARRESEAGVRGAQTQMQISRDYMTWQQTDGQRDDRMKQQMMARKESEAGVRGAQTQMQISLDYMTWQQTDRQGDDRMKQQMMAGRESDDGTSDAGAPEVKPSPDRYRLAMVVLGQRPSPLEGRGWSFISWVDNVKFVSCVETEVKAEGEGVRTFLELFLFRAPRANFTMVRMALFPLASILLLLAGTEGVPRNLKIQKNSNLGRQGSCSVNTDPIVASSGDVGIGSLRGTYNNNEDCAWQIQVPLGSLIQFTWNFFYLEGSSPVCDWDYVIVYDYITGVNLTQKLCDIQTPADFTSISNLALVTFTSDSSVVRQGFSLHFEAISDHYETTLPTERTTMSWYETTQPTERKTMNWYETTQPTERTTRNWYETTQPTERTTRNWYETTQPTERTTRNWYETTLPTERTTMNWYETTLPTERTTRNWYETTQEPQISCSVDAGPVMMPEGEITLGASDGAYNNNEHCVWEIQVPEGKVISFTWEAFDLEGPSPSCPYDYVDISDNVTGESLTGRLCGSNISPPVVSHSNSAVVTFISDASVTMQGFTLKFEAISVTTAPDHYETTLPIERTTMNLYETT